MQGIWALRIGLINRVTSVISVLLRENTRNISDSIKGDHLDFSHLTELKNTYITEIYIKKQCKSSIIKNRKITKKKWWSSLKRLHSLLSYF